jgi:acetyl-CoA C-acetyltransferase
MPALAALIARAYGRAHNLSDGQLRDVLGAVAVKNHARGVLNPHAQFRKAISLEEHHAARPVAEPLGLYDCAPITDGAAAVVLSSRRGGVRLAGMGHATDSAAVTRRQGLTSFNSTKKAAAQAYAMAQVNPQEVDFAEVHDAFTMFEVIGSEDLGFFPPGQGWKAALEGRTGPEGDLPINPSGGLKARGHPVGASGLAQVVEAYWLLTGQVEAARRLPKEPKVALTQSIGGLGNNNLVTILVPASRPLPQRGNWQSSFNRPLTPLAPPRPEPPPGEVTGDRKSVV